MAKKDKDTKVTEEQKEDFKKAQAPGTDAEFSEQTRANGFPAAIKAHYIKDLSIENPHSPYSIAPGMDKPKVGINVGLDYRKAEFEGRENLYEILVAINVTAERESHTAFIVELHYGILVELFELPEEQVEPFLLTEIPRYAFPFIRQIVASATADAGFIPLYLTPVNFRQLYAQKKAAEAAGKDGAENKDAKQSA